MDPADLKPKIQRLLGADGPSWQPLWIEVDGAHVLVVIVDPPQPGDPMWTLDKDLSRYQRGAVFVRRTGSTHQASPEEIRRLTTRAQPQDETPRLTVDLAATRDPVTVRPLALGEDALHRWIDEERVRLLAPLERSHSEDDTNGDEDEREPAETSPSGGTPQTHSDRHLRRKGPSKTR